VTTTAPASLVWRAQPQAHYRVKLPSSWRLRAAGPGTYRWSDPSDPRRTLQVLISGCRNCGWKAPSFGTLDPAALVPTGATARVARARPWQASYQAMGRGGSYPASGLAIVGRHADSPFGYVRVDLRLPAAEHGLAAAILKSFKVQDTGRVLHTGIDAMPLISRGAPASGDGGVLYNPALGNDGNYGAGSGSYLCAPPCSLTLDLSRVPAAKRGRVVVAWYNDESLYYAAAINSAYYNVPRDYTIDTSSAPGGANPPTSWKTVVSVTGNVFNGREHVVNLAGANWIRMHVTAANGASGNDAASFNLDVHDASAGANDTWLILGDSITQDDMGHYEPGAFMEQVNAAHHAYFPSQVDGGIAGWNASSPLQTDPRTGKVYIDEFLASFPGKFVSLDYGTNDANEGGALVAGYSANMTKMIRKVIAAGKIPVLRRSIPWGCTPGIKANGPTINAKLAALLKRFPQAVAGPDEWSYFQAHPSLINTDCIHPILYAGASAYRDVYVKAVLASVYAAAP
jgi:hypothetical protein